MRGILACAACAAVIGLSPVASAQWYASGSAGLAAVQDSDITETGGGISGSGEIGFDNGFVIGGAIGRQLGAFRVEGEVSYRQVDLDSLTVDSVSGGGVTLTNLGTFAMEGDASALAFMVNAFYDFKTGTKFVPFIGGGVGVARVNVQLDSIGGAASSFDEDDTVLAYQAGVGIGYRFNPNMMLTVEYRYFATQDPEFEANGFTDETEFSSHNFGAGIRISF